MFLAATAFLLVCPSMAWVSSIRGEVADVNETAYAVAVDTVGDVVATGVTQMAATGHDMTVVKLAATDGTVIWRRDFSGDVPSPGDYGRAIAIDPLGDVVAVGLVGGDLFVVKLSGTDGAELWRRQVDGGANLHDEQPNAVAIDSAGDVYVAGQLVQPNQTRAFAVLKFAQDTGMTLWQFISESTGWANSLSLNVLGDVIAAGLIATPGGPAPPTVVSLSSDDGSERWRHSTTSLNQCCTPEFVAVATDSQGHAIAVGYVYPSLSHSYSDGVVVKLSRDDGSTLWRRDIRGLAIHHDRMTAVSVDSQNDVVVGGWVNDTGASFDRAFVVAKLTGTVGLELWRHVTEGSAEHVDSADAVGVDLSDDVLATGRLVPAPCCNGQLAVVKLRKSDGAELWEELREGVGDSYGRAIAIDSGGDVVVAGYLSSSSVVESFSVIKVFGYSGNDYDCAADLDLDGVLACGDCNDTDSYVFPAAPQICDRVNNDCHDPSWPALPSSEADTDADGFAACEGDCDDADATQHPHASQLCDGQNNDCLHPSWPTVSADETDDDLDTYAECEGDCDDANPALRPGASETCNSIDENCNAMIDEDALGEDTDSDGVHNLCDNCRVDYNPTQLDTDHDAVGNSCDNCTIVANASQADLDGDQRGDVCDNCPTESNSFQDDYDGDRAGDACDNCLFDWNPAQTDVDQDVEGDLCDLDDGVIYILFHQPDYVEWQEEQGFTTWNSYRGDLSVLRGGGPYTQLPGSNGLASRGCGLTDAWALDDVDPLPGQAAFFLTTGVFGGESGLGTDSAGVTRPNVNPCP